MPNLQLPHVSKEIAIRLKKHKFNALCEYFYDDQTNKLLQCEAIANIEGDSTYSAPSLDLALLWLEEMGFEFYNDRTGIEIRYKHSLERHVKQFDTYNSTAFKEAQVIMALDIMDSETKKINI